MQVMMDEMQRGEGGKVGTMRWWGTVNGVSSDGVSTVGVLRDV